MSLRTVSNFVSPQFHWLDWQQRPNATKEDIKTSFQRLNRSTVSGWGKHNGADKYCLCGVDELALLKKVILERYPDQKEFYVLDVGAGNFQWSQAVADFIESQLDLPKDIKVHIIGIRGEGYLGKRIFETDRCKIYHLGAFKVEEVFSQFKEQGLDLENKLDLVVSRWCIRHVNDGVGLLQQLFNLTRPKHGYLLFDGFYFLRNEETMEDSNANDRLTQLFLDMKVPFLMHPFSQMHSLNHFILKRPDETHCRIPMSYVGPYCVGDSRQIGCENVTRFKREAQPTDHETFRRYDDSSILSGNKRLYEWLKQNALLDPPHLTWKPLQEKDDALASPPIHQAVLKEDLSQVEELLKQGMDINESDAEGCTPLHLAVQKRSLRLFQFLMNRGPRIDLFNRQDRTVLHEAAAADKEGIFLQTLIDAGANVESRSFFGRTPLEVAVDEKNPNAAEIFFENGATVSLSHRKKIHDPIFNSLHQKGLIPFEATPGGFGDLIQWIKQGQCVSLHANYVAPIIQCHSEKGKIVVGPETKQIVGSKRLFYYSPNAYNTDPTFIDIEITPEMAGVLDEGEWPGFLQDNGFTPCDENSINIAKFRKTQKYRF